MVKAPNTEKPEFYDAGAAAGGANTTNSFGMTVRQAPPEGPFGTGSSLIDAPAIKPSALTEYLVNRKVSKQAAEVAGEVLIARLNAMKDVVLEQVELHRSAAKQRLLHSHLDTTAEITKQINALSRHAEKELVDDFTGFRISAIRDYQRRQTAVEQLEAEGAPEHLISRERENVSRWCDIEMSNLEARLEITLKQYAAQFTRALDAVSSHR